LLIKPNANAIPNRTTGFFCSECEDLLTLQVLIYTASRMKMGFLRKSYRVLPES